MKFLNFIRNNFERVLAYDTEFHFDLTKTIPQKVLCFCYVDIFTGKKFQYWEYDQSISHPHFDFDKVLLVSYNATAEIGCHLNQLHGKPSLLMRRSPILILIVISISNLKKSTSNDHSQASTTLF